jgi:hypothetical protein
MTGLATGKEEKTAYKDLKLSSAILERYAGKYELVQDSTRYVNIYKEGDRWTLRFTYPL